MKKSLYLKTICFSLLLFGAVVQTYAVETTSEEMALYELIMQYRAAYNLPRIPLSPSLTYVAQLHARDVNNYYSEFPVGCNAHSWSEHGKWTKCDYYPDHRNAACMWSKPQELTSYTGYGFEIFCGPGTYDLTASESLEIWKSSSPHNAVIINQGKWSSHPWKAIGIGIYKGCACVWFGEKTDSASFTSLPTLP